jgi:hypothetical protein
MDARADRAAKKTMTVKTDKMPLRLTLEAIAADLRHAYGFIAPCQLVSEGQRNVAGLIARQISRIEDLIAVEDGGPRHTRSLVLLCPFECGYRTGTSSVGDVAAHNSLALHLQRMKHGLSRREAITRANAADVRPVEWPQRNDVDGGQGDQQQPVQPSATASPKSCLYGHTVQTPGCLDCVLLFDYGKRRFPAEENT